MRLAHATVSRAKLPRTHSYPVGLEQLGVALEPECGQAQVVFECYPVALQAQGFPYRVLTFTPGGEDAPELAVAAVRRDLKPLVRDLILKKALPYIRQACRGLAPGTRIEFHFDEAGRELLGPRSVGTPEVQVVRQA
jgi:hypothetical protein